MLRLKVFTLSIIVFLFVLDLGAVNALTTNIKIDFSGNVDFIIDGDTFDVTLNNSTRYRVRMADINAVELEEEGYAEAREYLRGLIYEKTVYLDVDDQYVYENHGTGNRLVCVTYLEYNSTHLMNVNKALNEAGHAKLRNYDNQFSPYEWSLFVSKEQIIPEFSSIIFVTIIMIILGICVVAVKSSFKFNQDF